MKKSLILIGLTAGALMMSGCGDKKEATVATTTKDDVACKKAYSDLNIETEAKATDVSNKIKQNKQNPNGDEANKLALGLLTDMYKAKAEIDSDCAEYLAKQRLALSSHRSSWLQKPKVPITYGTPKHVGFH